MVSCDKSDDPIPKEEIASQLPKQVFFFFENDTPLLYAVKYDTINRLIEVYYDDTTNANPYDVLAKKFQYNNDGYLTSYYANDESGSFDEKKTISRTADNQIQWIAAEYAYNGSKDTTKFNYTSNGDGLTITTFENTYYDNSTTPWYADSMVYKFNSAYKMLESGRKDANSFYVFTYNSNGSLQTMVNGTYIANFTYGSGIPDGSYDIALMAFLGKDYYIQQLKDLYPFNSFYEDNIFSLSATDPYHMTKFAETYTDENGEVVNDARNYQYEVQQNRVSKITLTSAEYGTDQILFKY